MHLKIYWRRRSYFELERGMTLAIYFIKLFLNYKESFPTEVGYEVVKKKQFVSSLKNEKDFII